MKQKLFAFSLLIVFFLTSGLGCKIAGEVANYPQTTLRYWGVTEAPDAIAKLTAAYTGRHPKITVQYQKFRAEEYKTKMLEAWVAGQGPDLFMIPVTQLREYLKYLQPMPATMKAPVDIQKGTIKKEIVSVMQTYDGLTTKNVRDQYIDTVANDVIVDGKIYGLPYSIDALSVFYNRDLLKNNNIPLPAKNWQELIEQQAPTISRADDKGAIIQSTIALGTTNNIPHVMDIVSTLMMQLGITLGDTNGAVFQGNPKSLEAIQFFLSFGQEGLKNYSWNKDQPNALDAFASGKVAYYIGYPYEVNVIKTANPKLDFDIIPMLTPLGAQDTTTYANYWVTVVTKPRPGASADDLRRAELAWQYLAESTKAGNVKAFLNMPDNPRLTALRELVNEQKANPILGAFAQNLLRAESWYRGYNYTAAQAAFVDMLDTIRTAYQTNANPTTFLNAGATRINQTYKPPTE
jgi:ABC-type glycerol-3-phosphate transport system substrate-binding protein